MSTCSISGLVLDAKEAEMRQVAKAFPGGGADEQATSLGSGPESEDSVCSSVRGQTEEVVFSWVSRDE